MPHTTVPVGPPALAGMGLVFVIPSTAQLGASIVAAQDWSTFESEDANAPDWTEEEIVFLHWRLLLEIQELADPNAPLGEKLETLRWVFTESEKDTRPFSFVSCLRVVGCSPLSPVPYCGLVDCETIREHIAGQAKRWLHETLAHYPAWVGEALAHQPTWIEDQLARNPQWINEQVRKLAVQRDLFA